MSVLVLALGGLTVDVFRALDVRREVTAVADAAAVAGASGLAVPLLREEGVLELDVDAARERALAAVARQDGGADLLGGTTVEVAPDGVAVEVTTSVDLLLLRLLTPGAGPLEVRVRAEAEPALAPVP